MKMSTTLMALCVLTNCAFSPVASAEVDVPKSQERVIDTTNTLSKDQRIALMKKSEAIDTATGTVAITVMVPTAGQEGIDSYSQRVAETLHPGHAGDDRAVVLVIAKNDKTWAIRTTRNTGQTFTDADTKHVLNDMRAFMKANKGDFYGTINLYYDKIGPFVKKDTAKMSVNPVPVTQPEEDYTGTILWLAGGLAILSILGGVAYVVFQNKRRDEERRRIREFNETLNRDRKYSSGSSYMAGAATGYVASSSSKPKKTEPSRSKSSDDSSSSYTPSYTPSYSSGGSSSSSWSSPSSYDSGSSSSSYDGGGSSGGFD